MAIRPFAGHSIHQEIGADPIADHTPTDPALVDDAEDIVGRAATQQADDREHVQDGEGRDRMGPPGRLGREPTPR